MALMLKVSEIFKTKKHTYSFEFFPPKTEQGAEKLFQTIEELAVLKPDFISCTYGAGGGNRDKTFEIVQKVQEKHQIPGVAHLTCVLSTKEQLKQILADVKNRGIHNILALRGDAPKEFPSWQPTDENLKYSSELAAFIRQQHGDYFGIAVAGFPEGHLLCRDRNLDAQYLKLKITSGADFVITQLFFNNQDYFDYVERLRKIGVTNRVIPGILPITDYDSLIRFCNLCGATVTEEIQKIFAPIKDDKEKTLEAGIKFAIRQCQELLKGGAPGLHFYSLNKKTPTDIILSEVRV